MRALHPPVAAQLARDCMAADDFQDPLHLGCRRGVLLDL
jgi:hypothetical protein